MEGEQVEMGALIPQVPHPTAYIHSSQRCQESYAPVRVLVCVCLQWGSQFHLKVTLIKRGCGKADEERMYGHTYV